MTILYRISLWLALAVLGLGFLPLVFFDWGRGFALAVYAGGYMTAAALALGQAFLVSLIAAFGKAPPPSAKWVAGAIGLGALAAGLILLFE